ncbi:MAG TPA: triose-phosphate isomerase [Blastocatellia bacterium]|nr:triose-phosphate isomerase [Blastocatellia bacterium]
MRDLNMRRPVIAGNWKMHKTIPEALEFVRAFKPLVVASTHCEIVIAPPFTAIKPTADRLEGSNIEVASQDLASEPGPGAFTGEVSASMIRDAGARWAIVGHSERRQYYGETDESVNAKIRASIAAGLSTIVCVGERLKERDEGRAEQVVESQLSGGMRNLTVSEAARIIVAYEPVWAIGTGRTATPETAQQMHAFIRTRISAIFGDRVAEKMRILYGGSVKADNIASLMSEADIDGALVGGASLDAVSFAGVVNYKSGR